MWTTVHLVLLFCGLTAGSAAARPATPFGPGSVTPGDRTIDCDTTYTTAIIRSFEMVSNADGAVRANVGFDVTDPPTDRSAYSADWYRDVLQGEGSVLDLPHGMQAQRGWYFLVAGPSNVIGHQYAEYRWTRAGANNHLLMGNTYELRFTPRANKAFTLFTDGQLVDVPFEVWYLGRTTASRGDDVRMIPWLFDIDEDGGFSFQLDHEASGGENDPYSDWMYYVMPEDDRPGDSGYRAFVEAAEQGLYAGEGTEHLARVVLMNWDRHQGESSPGAGDGPIGAMPELGTVLRLRFHDQPDTVQVNIACRTVIDVNRWRVALSANGIWAEDADGFGGPGGEWPKDSTLYAIYAGGCYVGALKGQTPSVSEIEWRSEFQPGDILNEDPGPIDSLVAADPSDPLNRVFVIDTTRTGQDWDEWPADKGAPLDENGDPLLVGDQDSWAIFNDLDPALHTDGGDPILGIEIQRSTHGFVSMDALGDAFFVRWRLTNKSTNAYPDAYFGIWMDPDLRAPTDDLIGIDTLRSMAFVYNGYEVAGTDVAVGLDLLRGPEDDQGTPLPPSSFSKFINGLDPSDDWERYNVLRGLTTSGDPRPNGPFDVPGDPVTGQGWTDGDPADRRWLLSCGPFTLGPGETKEILAACVAASGTDRLDAIVRLRQADDLVDLVFRRSGASGIGGGPEPGASVESIVLVPASPNPFSAGTVLSFLLPRRESVRLGVYDVLGQRVRSIIEGETRPAGLHQVFWDGKDQDGRRLPSGVYIGRLSAGGHATSTTLVRIAR